MRFLLLALLAASPLDGPTIRVIPDEFHPPGWDSPIEPDPDTGETEDTGDGDDTGDEDDEDGWGADPGEWFDSVLGGFDWRTGPHPGI
ncbi:MAG: hypothetical protein WC911_02055 [Thermoleophilia bacterium]